MREVVAKGREGLKNAGKYSKRKDREMLVNTVEGKEREMLVNTVEGKERKMLVNTVEGRIEKCW